MNKNEATIRFVKDHREEDVRALALQARRDSDVDLPWALDQIQGWQTARKKLPTWAAIEGIIYPPHLSMEQCSSEQTAIYKCGIVEQLPQACREMLVDLTGGFGVDFAFMARCCKQAVYVERQEHLCDTAQHNFSLLGLAHATVMHGDAEDVLNGLETDPESTLIYLDPARRDINSSRTYAIADCSPNVLEMLDRLFSAGHHVLIKLSPMLDWHKALSDLGERVTEVHIVSTANECKELLILLDANHTGDPVIYCVNDDQRLSFTPIEKEINPAIATSVDEAYLYEPNASIMKAGCFHELCEQFGLVPVGPNSHLFVRNPDIAEPPCMSADKDFPGRVFQISAISSMNKRSLRQNLQGITQANISTRNFPLKPEELRRRLKLRDGGDTYLFGTTLSDGSHVILICKKWETS